jgi:hypothetical protein
MSDSTYPKAWKEYISSLKRKGKKPARDWAVFAARYRAASSYTGAHFSCFSDKTAKGYSEGIRLLLTYSAFEAACIASGHKPHDCPVLGDDGLRKKARVLLQKSFKKTPESEFPLRHALRSQKLSERVDAFLEGKDNDLLPIASALRHLFAHGIWTPHGAAALSKTTRDALHLLSQSLLVAADELFESSVVPEN